SEAKGDEDSGVAPGGEAIFELKVGEHVVCATFFAGEVRVADVGAEGEGAGEAVVEAAADELVVEEMAGYAEGAFRLEGETDLRRDGRVAVRREIRRDVVAGGREE